MSRFSSLFINPVLNKEIKLRFRSFKSFIGIFFYLAFCGIISLAFIYIEGYVSYSSGFTSEDSRILFIILSLSQLGLAVFMAPGLTAGAISGEREKQTLNILLTTDQSSTLIILSKLFSSIAFLILMLLASLPLYSIVFLYGGVSPQLVLLTIGMQLITMIMIASLGMMFSTIIRKTMVATISTYGVMLFIIVGTLIVFALTTRLFIGAYPTSGTTNYIPYLALMLNPAVVMFSILEPSVFHYEFQNLGITWPLSRGFLPSSITITVISLLIAIKRLRPSLKSKNR